MAEYGYQNTGEYIDPKTGRVWSPAEIRAGIKTGEFDTSYASATAAARWTRENPVESTAILRRSMSADPNYLSNISEKQRKQAEAIERANKTAEEKARQLELRQNYLAAQAHTVEQAGLEAERQAAALDRARPSIDTPGEVERYNKDVRRYEQARTKYEDLYTQYKKESDVASKDVEGFNKQMDALSKRIDTYNTQIGTAQLSTSRLTKFEQVTGKNILDVKTDKPVVWKSTVSDTGEISTQYTATQISKPEMLTAGTVGGKPIYVVGVGEFKKTESDKKPIEDISKTVSGITGGVSKDITRDVFERSGVKKIPYTDMTTRDVMDVGFDIQKRASVGFEKLGIIGSSGYLSKVHPLGSSFWTGVLEFPGSLITVGTAVPYASEVTYKKVSEDPFGFPGWAGSMMLSGGYVQYESAREDPFRFIGNLIGASLIFGAVKSGATKTYGVTRSLGKTYIPIKEIGYEPKVGYPLSGRITAQSLSKSFYEGTLYPEPSSMSISSRVPYVPKSTKLPGYTTNTPSMYTAWEKTPRAGFISKQFELGRGSSEIPGAYGSPVAETYFAKVGGQMPRVFGLEFGFVKKPAILYTELTGVEAAPRGSYTSMGEYAKTLEPGRAIFPLTKMEYEAVLPEGSVLKPVRSRYYTRVGGIGKSNLFGTRIPIFETKVVGKNITGISRGKVPKYSFESYRASPIIDLSSLFYSVPVSGVSYGKYYNRYSQSYKYYNKTYNYADKYSYKPYKYSYTPKTKTYVSDVNKIKYNPQSYSFKYRGTSQYMFSYDQPSYIYGGSYGDVSKTPYSSTSYLTGISISKKYSPIPKPQTKKQKYPVIPKYRVKSVKFVEKLPIWSPMEVMFGKKRTVTKKRKNRRNRR